MALRRFGNLVFHPDDGRLENRRTGLSEHLRPKTARLLECLHDHAGEVVARETVIESVWGSESVVDFEAGLAALMRDLRQALSAVGGSPEQVETVPRRGYRLNVPAVRAGGWRLALVVAGLSAVLAGAGLGAWLALGGPGAEQPPGDHSLAILPFEVYEEVAGLPEHAGLLLADTLLAELLRRPVEGLELIGRTSLRPYVDRHDVVSAVAEDLGVGLLIEGAVLPHGREGWRVELRLLSVPPGRVVWSTTVSGEADEGLDVAPSARALAQELVAAWPELRQRLEGGDASD